jgi:hypothetical protein
LIDTDGVSGGLTTIFTAGDVAVEGTAQADEEFITTVTTSPFTNEDEEKLGEFVPAFTPFTFH